MKLYDCFLYNGEKKMLQFRLAELSDVVDKFIILESEYTFRGDKKATTFSITDYSKFADKIVYVKDSSTPVADAWGNETRQRRLLKEGFRNLEVMSNDIVMLSDVDEIPDPNTLKEFKTNGLQGMRSFFHNFYYYNFKCRNSKKWVGTVIGDVQSYMQLFNFDFERVRQSRWSLPLIGQQDDYTSGGWHFSYFGDIDYIVNKLNSFSHQEYNTDYYKDKERIRTLIESGKDLFSRDTETFEIVHGQTYLPKNINILT